MAEQPPLGGEDLPLDEVAEALLYVDVQDVAKVRLRAGQVGGRGASAGGRGQQAGGRAGGGHLAVGECGWAPQCCTPGTVHANPKHQHAPHMCLLILLDLQATHPPAAPPPCVSQRPQHPLPF